MSSLGVVAWKLDSVDGLDLDSWLLRKEYFWLPVTFPLKAYSPGPSPLSPSPDPSVAPHVFLLGAN